MKKREIEHWTKNEYLRGMLLFAQALEEETFNYSYESYKVPALNSHYLCYDVMQTANDINKKYLWMGILFRCLKNLSKHCKKIYLYNKLFLMMELYYLYRTKLLGIII